MSPALVVLAAGLGSRFGGDKQVAAVGPHGETILDYTIFDAIRCGFHEVVFVVRPGNRAQVAAGLGERAARRIAVRYAIQDTARPLPGLATPGRTRPWGTAHALACALADLDRPCAVANADDWYGPGALRRVAAGLARRSAAGVLATWPLGRTLSPRGPVNRAVCGMMADGRIATLTETGGLTAASLDGAGPLHAGTPVSLNLWGFQPEAYPHLRGYAEAFISRHRDDHGRECQLPAAVLATGPGGPLEILALPTDSPWAGLTYASDRPLVQEALADATRSGEYPAPLWGDAPPERWPEATAPASREAPCVG